MRQDPHAGIVLDRRCNAETLLMRNMPTRRVPLTVGIHWRYLSRDGKRPPAESNWAASSTLLAVPFRQTPPQNPKTSISHKALKESWRYWPPIPSRHCSLYNTSSHHSLLDASIPHYPYLIGPARGWYELGFRFQPASRGSELRSALAFKKTNSNLHNTFSIPSKYLQNTCNMPSEYLQNNFKMPAEYLQNTFQIPAE